MLPGRFHAVHAVAFAALLFAGCLPPKRPVPFTPPTPALLAPADDPCDPLAAPPAAEMTRLPDVGPYDPAASSCPMRRPKHIVAFSGGGAYGAYSAGFMNGWTQAGTRPEFDVVTGISTGSLIAPYAFLGPEYDSRLGRLYTGVQPADIFRIRSWLLIPFRDAVATSAPLKQLLDSQVTPALMEMIAAEHKKGRRLYVGTTNLDTRRLTVWDMGAIACRPSQEACRLFRDVLLASCAVPGMLPPVKFELEVDGRRVTELHADGGAAAQIFMPSHVFAHADKNEPANMYAVVAGKLYPDAAPVRSKILPVLGASATSLIYAYCRADASNLYGQARAAGMKFHLTSLPAEFPTLENSVDFNRERMQKLFDEGSNQGCAGPAWKSGPPSLSPGDGDFIRNGTKLRRVEAPR
ncbi:MAG: patatin-like phospholipase family protein [Gemmataceae bacterium]